MSNGITHDRFSKIIIIPSSVLLGILVYPLVGIIGGVVAVGMSIIGGLIQRVASPDLDVDRGFYGFYLTRKYLGILGIIWEYFWKPYALIVHHRSWISHLPIVSTAIRFIYLFGILFLINYHLFINWWDWWLYLFIGMMIGDWGHILLDFTPFGDWYERIVQ